ncbi:glycogen debranching protein GlgX [Arthrobacter cupressi]|uniref:Glycogen operon protein n=1 Tax=Arthrobacter cupressi TaxID=1045773 RepID=A0A1G8XGN7_9MICC|nr:glycogen debranching protein GlgX [Arthrobacter cupressi]SDJ89596.1 glycogen operon protein [Arthrobacter cupressi]
MVMPIFDTAATVDAARPTPLGVSDPRPGLSGADPTGPDQVNVAVWAPGLEHVELAFREPGGTWRVRTLPNKADGVHFGIVDGMPPGTRYGFRAADAGEDVLPLSLPAIDFDDDGAPQLLLDPYGRAVHRNGELLSSVRMDPHFDWGNDRRMRTPWRDTIVYEAHVRGQSKLHPDIPEHLRGTYAGMAHPAMIEHFHALGVTAIQLLPVHFHLDEQHLQYLGLTNYWGYNTAAFFAPHPDYATQAAQDAGPHAVQDEFKGMVKLLHAAGLEVILDVVYNHTAEAGPDGDVISFRGLGEEQYYRHDAHGRYLDTTGCGNTLDFSHPRVVDLAIDSLRYWVEEFHIDGFRFDLAVTLCRNARNEFDPNHPFLKRIGTDPVLSSVKLIAEPWDVGWGGWQTGAFPKGWVDWNDHFRDEVRRFWLSDRAAAEAGLPTGNIGAVADALSGSTSIFARSGRSRLASLNFITAHDGFTLADLVSYDRKHNEANGEQNRDGHSDNRSYNHGFEGRTENEAIVAQRARSRRNLMTTLMVSLGVPMITAGDELGRTQHGNNNAYCQDNSLTWIDWTQTPESHAMFRNTKRVIRIRKEFLAAQPEGFPEKIAGIEWFDEKGERMTEARWHDHSLRLVQMLIGSEDGGFSGLVVLNGNINDTKVVLPKLGPAAGGGHTRFELRLTTSELDDRRRGAMVAAGEKDVIQGNTINIYRA